MKGDSPSQPASAPCIEEDLDEATLRRWIKRHASRSPSHVALVTPTGSINYTELDRRADAFASFLVELGVEKGDVVAAQLPNGVEFVVAYLAAGYAGAVFQTVHMPYRAAEIEPLLTHSKAKIFICLSHAKDFPPAAYALSLRASGSSLRHVIAVGADLPAQAIPFAQPNDRFGLAGCDPSPRDKFLLLYTSGTTSAPKGVPIVYGKFLPNAALSARELGISEASIVLSAAPLTHLYGLFSLNAAFAVGATTALMPSFTPQALAQTVEALRPTALFTAPAHLLACLNEKLLSKERLASLGFILISGSACPLELARSVQALMTDGNVLQLWGMSELQAGSFTRPDDSETVRFESVGRASPGTELRVTFGDTVVPSGIEGELEVHGRSVFEGYLANEAATQNAFSSDGWFRTGDLAQLDEDGNLRITGRVKDVINRGGVKFNPTDIEQLIDRHPAVALCAIVPMPDPVLGERACCFAVPSSQASSLQLSDLCLWLEQHKVAKLKWPERLELIAEMPMTPTRKVMKGELTKRAKDLK